MRSVKRFFKKQKKGSLKREPVFYILLFVFVLLIILLFVTGLLDFLKDLLGFEIDSVSLGSAMALGCAINSLAVGDINDYTCMNEGLLSTGGVEVYPLYKFDDVIGFLQASTSPTSNILYDLKRIKRKIENRISGLFGIELAYAEENDPVAYVFGESVVVCANKSILRDKKYWSLGMDSNKMNETIKNNFTELDTDEFKCKIFRFELKQQTKNIIGVTDPTTGLTFYTPSMGDPDILVYYEVFPKSEAKAWADKSDQLGIVGIVIGGVTNAVIPIGARFANKLAVKFLGREISILTSLAGGGLKKEALGEGYRRVVFMALSKNNVPEVLGTQVEKKVIMRASSNAAKKLADGDIEAAKKEIIKTINKWAKDESIDIDENILESFAEEAVYKFRKYPPEVLRNPNLMKRTLQVEFAIETSLVDDAGKFLGIQKSEELEKFLDDLYRNIPDPKAREEVLKTIFEKGGTVRVGNNVYSLSTFGYSNPNQFRNALKNFFDNYLREDLKETQTMYARAPSEMKRGYRTKVYEFLELAKNSRNAKFMMLNVLDNTLSMSGGIDINGDGIPDDLFPVETAKCMSMLPGMGKYACTIAVAIGMKVIEMESKLQYEPVSLNSIGVFHPMMFFHNSEPVQIPLVDEAFPYFIEYPGSFGNIVHHKRLYFASPCKSDIVLEKDLGGETCYYIDKCLALEKTMKEVTINCEPRQVSSYLLGTVEIITCKSPFANYECTPSACDLKRFYNCSAFLNNPPSPESAGIQGICWCLQNRNDPNCVKWAISNLGCGYDPDTGSFSNSKIFKVNGQKVILEGVNLPAINLTNLQYIEYNASQLRGVKGAKVCETQNIIDKIGNTLSNIGIIIGTAGSGTTITYKSMNVPVIKVTTVSKYSNKPNFCYYDELGKFTAELFVNAIFTGVELVIDAIVTGGTLGAGSVAIPVIHGVLGAANVWATGAVTSQYRWPGYSWP